MDCKKCIYCVQEKDKKTIICDNKKLFKLTCDYTINKPIYCRYFKTLRQYLKEIKNK